nr:hypothetical protein CPGR_05788 [Mycolicibacter nonchromogenicus]
MSPLAEQVQVDLAQRRQEAVPVGHCLRFRGAGGVDLQPIVDQGGEGQRRGEQPVTQVLHRDPVSPTHNRDRTRARAQSSDHGALTVVVGAEDRMRVIVHARHQPIEILGMELKPTGLVFDAGHRVLTSDATARFAPAHSSPAC